LRATRARWLAIGCAAALAAGIGMGHIAGTGNAPAAGGWSGVQPVQAAGPGQAVYGQFCASCHQGGGSGVPGTFPPLTGPVTNGDAHFVARIVLYGLQGRTTVKGQAYNVPMTGFASRMTDAQIANVLTYVRSAFGNSASAVTEDVVKTERAVPGTGADNYGKYPK
jgi:mono/diheme cytochrome c family protein